MFSQANHVQEWSISNLGLIQASPPEVQEAAGHEFRLVQALILSGEHALGGSFEQIELSIFQQDALFDKAVNILHLLLRSERTRKNVTIWHFDSDFRTSMVGLTLDCLKLDGATIAELVLLFLIGNELESAPSFIFFCDVNFEVGIT